jgi:histidinol-phosphate aminotransferase
MKEKLFREALQKIRPYVPGESIEAIKLRYGLKNVVKLASNENPLGPSPEALKVLPRELLNLNLYPRPEAPMLKDKISRKFGVTPEQIIVGNGTDEIILLIALVFLNAGDRVLLPWPSFQTFEIVTNLMAAETVRVPFKNNRYDLADFAAAIDEKTKMIFLCNPNNPTGVIFGQSDWQKFLEAVPDDVVVVVDEAYSDYVTNPDFPRPLDVLKTSKSVIVTRTFSKIYGLAGLRAGFAMARTEIIAEMSKVRLPFSVNTLAQAAAAAALDDEAFVRQSLKMNEEGKKYLYKQLAGLGLKYIETESNFIYFDVEMNAATLAEKMNEEGVIVRPLTGFGLPKAMRVTVGQREENERFILVLTRCLDWLR